MIVFRHNDWESEREYAARAGAAGRYCVPRRAQRAVEVFEDPPVATFYRGLVEAAGVRFEVELPTRLLQTWVLNARAWGIDMRRVEESAP